MTDRDTSASKGASTSKGAGFDPLGLAAGAMGRIGDLVRTTLDAGASMARSAAAATATKDLPPRGATSLEDIVTFGTAAAGNLFRYAMDAARTAERFASTMTPGAPTPESSHRPPPPGDPAGMFGGTDRPRVARGAVLRVPLLVENAGADPTPELDFDATGVQRVSAVNGGAGDGIGVDQVTFTPTTLTVGPRDFEKLTVRIHTAPGTATGTYRATVTGGGGWFSTVIEFDVTDPVS